MTKPYFMNVVVWGERHRRDLLNYLLPSLLSPNNFPAMSRRRKTSLLIGTTREDWAAIKNTEIFAHLAQVTEPIFQEIPFPDRGINPLLHASKGHLNAANKAYAEKACLGVLTPDNILSDGALARISDLIDQGIGVVKIAALRFSKERVVERLAHFYPVCSPTQGEGAVPPIAFPSSVLVATAMSSFHSETAEYEWNTSYYLSSEPEVPVAAIWRVPGDAGLVVHSMCWMPLLMDYSYVANHDVSTLEKWTIDGDYLHKNFSDDVPRHTIDSSDEAMLLTWGPEQIGKRPMKPWLGMLIPGVRELMRAALLRRGYHSPLFDDERRAAFWKSIRWSVRDVPAEWARIERKAYSSLWRSIGDHKLARWPGVRSSPTPIPLSVRLMNPLLTLTLQYRKIIKLGYLVVILNAMKGETDAIKRIMRRLKNIVYRGHY